jgi:tRNA-specific 2-thiouridylase
MKTVVIGMSGGVDSSVAAYLLKQQGYRVRGVSFQLYERQIEDTVAPSQGCSFSSLQDAAKTASMLGIDHEVINLSETFSALVVEPFIASYLQGMTPNPCIFCNSYIKFPALAKYADALGAECIATGHYARIGFDEAGWAYLQKGVDEKKDQSYVLYMLSQNILKRLLLPLGALKKAETKAVAHLLNLSCAQRPESQEICFIPRGDYAAFIRSAGAHLQPGPIIYGATGEVVGCHDGIHNYTIGQRKRLPALGKPVYVIRIEADRNAIIIGTQEEALKRMCKVRVTSWIQRSFVELPPDNCFRISAKIRSMMKDEPAAIHFCDNDTAVLTFDEPQWAPAPGQSAVFYSSEKVVGGGILI